MNTTSSAVPPDDPFMLDFRTEGSSPTSSEAWSNIGDPITFDFFGFDFDFTDYADDSLFESDGVTRKKFPVKSEEGSSADLTNSSSSSQFVSLSASTSDMNASYPAQYYVEADQNSYNYGSAAPSSSVEGQYYQSVYPQQKQSPEEYAMSQKRQKIEQYASAMRKSATTMPPVAPSPGENNIPAYLQKPVPIAIPPSTVGVNPVLATSTLSTITLPPVTRRVVKKKTNKGTKAAFLPPPIAFNDVRRTFTKIMFNGFNSCDMKVIQKTIEDYMIKEIIAIHRYEGIQNPYGKNISRIKGRDAYVDMWSALVKSAPDFFFDILETRAFYDPNTYHMIVASKFSWFGTRVMDVKYTTKIQIPTEASSTTAESSDQPIDPSTTSITTSDESIFNSEKSNEFDNVESTSALNESNGGNFVETTTGKFYVDTTPLKQKMQMSCKGTFLVYIYTNHLQEALKKQQQQQSQNTAIKIGKKTPTTQATSASKETCTANNVTAATTMAGNVVDTSLPTNITLPLDPSYVNKIFKVEFIYTASDEKLIQEGTQSTSESTSAEI